MKDTWTCKSGSWVWIQSREHIYQIIFIDKCYLNEMTSLAFGSTAVSWGPYTEVMSTGIPLEPHRHKQKTYQHIFCCRCCLRDIREVYPSKCLFWKVFSIIFEWNDTDKMLWSTWTLNFIQNAGRCSWCVNSRLMRREVSYNDHGSLDCRMKSHNIPLFLLNHEGGHTDNKNRENGD